MYKFTYENKDLGTHYIYAEDYTEEKEYNGAFELYVVRPKGYSMNDGPFITISFDDTWFLDKEKTTVTKLRRLNSPTNRVKIDRVTYVDC